MRGQLTKKEIITIIIFMLIITIAIMISLKFTLYDEKEVKIDNLELIIENGTRKITGEVKNTSGKDIKYIEVELQMFDDEGIILNDVCNLGSLKQDEKWRFTFYLFYYDFDYCNLEISKVEYENG
jgi:hypothetical protein